MRSTTVSTEIAASPETVYEYVRNPDNLCDWAAGICKSVTVKDGVWWVDTGTEMGTVKFVFCPDNDFGVLDHEVTLAAGTAFLNPMRAVKNGAGSELMFTVFHWPDMDDEQHAKDVQAVTRDLEAIKARLEA